MSQKRASYREGVTWIALNDAAGDDQPVEDIALYISVALLADLFGKSTDVVAADVKSYRDRIKDSQ